MREYNAINISRKAAKSMANLTSQFCRYSQPAVCLSKEYGAM